MPALSQYLKENEIDEITLEYFGEDSPEGYGINSIPFKEIEYAEPEDKVYAVSVQHLDSVKWTENYTPIAKAGYSIFVYDLREKEL